MTNKDYGSADSGELAKRLRNSALARTKTQDAPPASEQPARLLVFDTGASALRALTSQAIPQRFGVRIEHDAGISGPDQP